MFGFEARSAALFANLPGFRAKRGLAKSPPEWLLQVVENRQDRERLKSLPR